MSRTRIDIGAPIAAADELGRTWRPVSVRYQGADYGARVQFHVVSGRAVWAFGECSDQAFEAINAALASKGEKAIARMLSPPV